MTNREIVRRAVTFQNPQRLAVDFYGDYPRTLGFDTDFEHLCMEPHPDVKLLEGVDEWGAVWEHAGSSATMGQVKVFPLADWSQLESLRVPDVNDPARWTQALTARQRVGEQFIIGYGCSLWDRVHFLRGLETVWMDIYDHPQELATLLDILAEMNIAALDWYQRCGADAIMWFDDWALQDRLMISPDAWRELWKPRYARVYAEAHRRGMLTFLHSCGNILSILDDLIDAGLDVIQMDQQLNMRLAALSRYAGRITFYCPADIQQLESLGGQRQIRQYCRDLVAALATPKGGFIAKAYPNGQAAGHTRESTRIMCEEFLAISRERFGG